MDGLRREHDEQAALVQWAALAARHAVDGMEPVPALAGLFAIPNGGHRHEAVAAAMKREGVKAGVPDLCLPVAVRHARTGRVYGALWIEMKTTTGRLSRPQQVWRRFLTGHGQAYALCRSFEEARTVILAYLSGRHEAGSEVAEGTPGGSHG